MLRYWKLIFISVLIVVSIGTYYVQNALAQGEYPEFYIETVSGDETEVESLTITGEYGVNQQKPGASVEITEKGSIYQGEMSYISQLMGFQNATIESLQSEYRNFMRAKGGSTPTFFESDKTLAYVGPYGVDELDGSLEVELLDKETNDVTAFQVTIPNMINFNFMNILDVQVQNDELMVIARIWKRGSQNESDIEEIHVYHINIPNQQIVTDEVILATDNSPSTEWFRIGEVNSPNNIGQEDYFVFRLDYMKGDKYNSATLDGTDYIGYHYETGEIFDMDVAVELDDGSALNQVYEDTIYFVETIENQLQINAYDIANGERNQLDIQTSGNVYEYNIMLIKNNKMYLTNLNDQQTNVFVLDIDSGKVLYEGKLEFQNPEEKQEDYFFYIYEMVVE